MTREEVDALADALRATAALTNYSAQWACDCEAVAEVCETFCGAYHRDEFLAACGIESRQRQPE